MPYRSFKHYGHERGLSCAFRQWQADSHCRFLHGYALAFTFTFEADTLDARNWVVDFGGLKGLKHMLETTFDHKTLVAVDDPWLPWFRKGHDEGILDIVEVDRTGCEAAAELAYHAAEDYLRWYGYAPRVRVVGVQVWEHNGNGAAYYEH